MLTSPHWLCDTKQCTTSLSLSFLNRPLLSHKIIMKIVIWFVHSVYFLLFPYSPPISSEKGCPTQLKSKMLLFIRNLWFMSHCFQECMKWAYTQECQLSFRKKEIRFVVTRVGRWGEGELDEDRQKVQTSSYNINKY